MEPLKLSIKGAGSPEDQKLMENNLKELSGVRSAKLIPFSSHAEIEIEFDGTKISKQQIIDVIKIGGDYIVEEQKAESVNESHHVKSLSSAIKRSPADETARLFFICGILGGVAAASIILNIVLAYLLLAPKT